MGWTLIRDICGHAVVDVVDVVDVCGRYLFQCSSVVSQRRWNKWINDALPYDEVGKYMGTWSVVISDYCTLRLNYCTVVSTTQHE